MPWVKLDDAFYDHRKTANAGPMAELLWYRALQWSNRNLSDGFIPVAQVRRLADFCEDVAEVAWSRSQDGDGRRDADAVYPTELADRLVAAGLWITVDGGWRFHQYNEHQRTSEEIRLLSQKRAEAGRKGAGQRWQDGKPYGKPIATGQQTDGNHDGKSIAEPKPEGFVLHPPTTESRLDGKAGQVLEALMIPERATSGPVKNRKAWETTVRSRLIGEHHASIERLTAEYPDAPPDVIAGHIRGETNTLRYYTRKEPA